jgi:hypothetical protein
MRINRKKPEPVRNCKHGHPMTPDNLTSSGKCLTCRHDREGFKGNTANKDKTHCPAGHPYSGDNLARYTSKNRTLRVCKMCRAIKSRRYYNDKIKPFRPAPTPGKRKPGRPRQFVE